ncbi:pyridoxamine 5'-phosphate oxidase family protein [Aquipuribacter hungaricus]|uniref:Pyridoxamine 5'-phosphate oxidase family protein n=1 Tax=Aquipuribacter hungaricus TaxID=545624 RepID=A0ABV7WJI7_9MICO
MEGLPRIETLDRRTCLELLAGAEVGRMVYAVPSEPPGVVPVSYVLDGPPGHEAVVVRTTHGSRLGRAVPGTAVSFEVDEIRTTTHEGWSIVASGVAEEVRDADVVRRVEERLRAWAPGYKDLVLRVPLERVSGRRLLSRDRVIQLPESPAPRWRQDAGWTPATRTAAEYRTDFDGR